MTKQTNPEPIRHSLAHLLAAAVLDLWPDAKPTIGPSIEDGFYYDFEFSKPISNEDLPKIEKKMREILKTWNKFEGKKVSKKEANDHYKNNPYKKELVEEIAEKKEDITFYTSGGFTDLCRGGHVNSAKDIKPDSFKLTSVAGAYWRGDEKNKMLTRIYGAAFAIKDELEAHLKLQEESKKRDHRKLGRELGLFTIIDEVGPGLPLFYPKGAILRRIVENFITEVQEAEGYVPIWIPHITKGDLYKISGHLDKYDAMYPPMDLKGESKYYIKPMNCPHFMMLYKSLPHSYRELPVRYTATTTNYRLEKSGELSGLTRVRSITQDDCHVFLKPDQIKNEIELMLHMIEKVFKAMGFDDFWVQVSLRDPKAKQRYIGTEAHWETAEAELKKAIIGKKNWKAVEAVGEAAFYGPKLDFMMKDVLGREWQLSTVQLDFNLPERFRLEYTDEQGKPQQPIVIHRAILGSTERFLGILIEHFGGAFPLWLSPVQATILPISDEINEYAQSLSAELKVKGIRVEIDSRSESIGKKIREAEMQKTPYMLIVGKKERDQKTVSVRHRGERDLGGMKLDKFIEKIQKEIETKSI